MWKTGERRMDVEVIRTKVKESINRVTGIEAATISDTASYDADLGLDSLSILEIAVDVETQFKFQASDEELSAIHTVEDAVSLVKKRLSAEVV
jgi:acyl carrier protein